VLWDAVVLPDGQAAVATLSRTGQAVEFVKDQYRHCKPMLVLGAAGSLLEAARIPAKLPSGADDPALLKFKDSGGTAALEAFAQAIVRHRCFERETDPPMV
jgi:catalase